MSNKVSSSSGGVGFCGWLTIAFIVLKLTNYISWSWIWVLCPLWISLSVVLLIILIIAIVLLFSCIVGN